MEKCPVLCLVLNVDLHELYFGDALVNTVCQPIRLWAVRRGLTMRDMNQAHHVLHQPACERYPAVSDGHFASAVTKQELSVNN